MKDKRELSYFLLQAIGELSEETVAEAKRRPVIPLRRIAAVAAAVVLTVGLLTGIIIYGVTDAPVATVTLDASYSVALSLNRDGKILSCTASSPEGERLTKGLGLTMTEAPEAAEKIVAAMIGSGDLNAYDNTLLVTVDGCDEKALQRAVERAYTAEGFSGALLCQQVSRGAPGSKDISDGKAWLIGQLTAHADDLDARMLAGLSVTDLYRIALSRGIALDGVALTGEPAPPEVSRDSAAEIAVSFLVERGGQATVIEAVLTTDGTAVYYHISLSGPHSRYVISVDSVSGRVLTYSEIPDAPPESEPTVPVNAAPTSAPTAAPTSVPTTVIEEYETPVETAAADTPAATAKTSPMRASSVKTYPTASPKKPTEPPADSAKRYITGDPYMNTTFSGKAIGYDASFNSGFPKSGGTRSRLALVETLDQMWDFLSPYDYSSHAENIREFYEEQESCGDYRYLVIVQLCDNERMVIFNRVVRSGDSLCPEISYEERDYETEGTWEKYSLQIVAIPASSVEGVTRFY